MIKYAGFENRGTAVRIHTAAGIDLGCLVKYSCKDFVAGDTQRKYADYKLGKSMKNLRKQGLVFMKPHMTLAENKKNIKLYLKKLNKS